MVVKTYDAGAQGCRNMFALNDPILTSVYRFSDYPVRFACAGLGSRVQPSQPLGEAEGGGREGACRFTQTTTQPVLV